VLWYERGRMRAVRRTAGVWAVGKRCGDTLIDRARLKWAVGLTSGLDRLEGKGIVAL
jgi:hypothetical protein